MSSTSNYDTGITPILPGRNVVFKNIRCPNAEINNLSVDFINGLPPPTASPITAPVNSILTVTSPSIATFTDSASLINLNIDGNLQLSGSSGTTGQIIKKTGATTQAWSSVTVGDITHGTAYQLLQTNSLGNAVEWTSNIRPSSLQFNAVNQTQLNYFNESLNQITPIIYENGNFDNINVSYQRIGSKVSVKIGEISVSLSGTPAQNYRRIGPIPAIYRPSYGTGSPTDPLSLASSHSECIPCFQTIIGSVSGIGQIGQDGYIYIFTNITGNTPGPATLTSFAHTFNYLIN